MVAMASSFRNEGRIFSLARFRSWASSRAWASLKATPGAAEVLAGVAAAVLVGIEHGERGRQASGCVRQMMVGDDEVDAESRGRFGRGEGANAGIDADDEARACCGCGFDHLALHAVAFAEAVGNVEADVACRVGPADHFDRGLEQDDGDGAIDVVVAVDENWLTIRDGGLDSGNGDGHSGHAVGVEKMIEAGIEEALSLVG